MGARLMRLVTGHNFIVNAAMLARVNCLQLVDSACVFDWLGRGTDVGCSKEIWC